MEIFDEILHLQLFIYIRGLSYMTFAVGGGEGGSPFPLNTKIYAYVKEIGLISVSGGGGKRFC